VSLTTFPNDEGYDELVVVKAIPFHSLCIHHLLPFHGVAHVAYLPGERIIGLFKLDRLVEVFARDLQLQERLTMQVADCLERHLQPKGVGVVLEAEHMCMSLRGVLKARYADDDVDAARPAAQRPAYTWRVPVVRVQLTLAGKNGATNVTHVLDEADTYTTQRPTRPVGGMAAAAADRRRVRRAACG
jgi:NADPH-dependent 7-cyano-7-deazaguanine reductase QueF